MPRCDLTRLAVERIKNTRHTRRTMYMDADIRSLLLEYRPSGTGTWYFRGKDENGKLKMIRLGMLDEMDVLEAKAQAYELQKFLSQGGLLSSRLGYRGGRLTFREFIETYYLPHAKARKRSWETEVGILRRHIMPVLAGVRLEAITRHSLSLWQENLRAKGLASPTCNRALFLLSYIFNCAKRWGFLVESPARYLSPLPETEYRERFLSEEEARRLLKALEADRDKVAAQVVRLLLFTGARRSEILAARWENIDLKRRVLLVPLSKSGRARYIPLSNAALQTLAEIPRRSEWLFPSPSRDGHLTTIFPSWDRVRRRAGLPDVRLHDLRHTFASFLVNAGCSLYEVQKLLGHHDPKMTTRYAHLAQESLLRAANVVWKKIGGKAG